MTNDGIRDLAPDDLGWVLDLLGERRARIVPYAPRFWNPAPNAREVHAKFLGNKINDPETVSIRTDHGLLFGFPTGDRYDIDDMALDDDSLWPTEGVALLQAASALRPLNMVCPVPEPPRRAAAETVGLRWGDSWWHKDLDPVTDGPAPPDPKLVVDGASGILVQAPPVYAPGGPVLLVDELADDHGLAAIESAAEGFGSPVAVVRQQADDSVRRTLLERLGYIRTSDFYGAAGADAS